MKFAKRTNTCGELRAGDIGKTVTLNGWVSDIRDLGGVLFINLRDRYGITQVTVNQADAEVYEKAKFLRLEYVISASGIVTKRTTANSALPTGEIEISCQSLQVLNESDTPPFVIEEDVKASEELRLKYRYLDIRRQKIMNNLIVRNKVYQITHRYFQKENFVEVETPVLMKSTPEGARDYLVPSRIHKGKFYALPQSPQTYKQLLMVAGLDRYVQICKCFRDEDLRADRQPEFTQIDLEMSFVEEKDVFNIVEGLMFEIWKEIKSCDLTLPFPVLSYDEAMMKYGTDKPDLRIQSGMEISELTNGLKNSGFGVFDNVIASGGIVAGINLKKQDVSRKVIDELTDYTKAVLKFTGLTYFKYNNDGTVTSPVAKYLDENKKGYIKKSFEADSGDTVFILCGEKKKVLTSLGNLRIKLAEKFGLIDFSADRFVWINNFPLFVYDEEQQRFAAEHHPFTMPHDGDLSKLDSEDRNEIESIRALCYDLVYNGSEFGSGSIRIHNRNIQQKVFSILKLSEDEQIKKFGFLLDAFRYGAPPHGGFAIGFDRVVATLCGTKDIRDTIAFPKTTSATSLMDNSPSEVDQHQLEELGIKIVT